LLHLLLFYICVAEGDIIGSFVFSIAFVFFKERLAYDTKSLCVSVHQHTCSV
jgi:hypothetical protein